HPPHAGRHGRRAGRLRAGGGERSPELGAVARARVRLARCEVQTSARPALGAEPGRGCRCAREALMAGRDPFANPEPLLRRVFAYVAYRVGNRSEAEDITSETFERALRYRDRYDERRGEPIAWLLGIARNCVYDAQLRPRAEALVEAEPTRPGVDAEVVGRLAL